MKSADLSDRPGRAAPPRSAFFGAVFLWRRFWGGFLGLCFFRRRGPPRPPPRGHGEHQEELLAPPGQSGGRGGRSRQPFHLVPDPLFQKASRPGRCAGRCRKLPSIAAKSPLQGKRGQDFILQCSLFRRVRIKRLRRRPPGQKIVSCSLPFGCFEGQDQLAIPLARAF